MEASMVDRDSSKVLKAGEQQGQLIPGLPCPILERAMRVRAGLPEGFDAM